MGPGPLLSCAALALAAASTPAAACRLALVLALDVSGSVDATEDRLQREGLAAALLSPKVVRAFLSGDPVALNVFEWSMTSHQRQILPGWEMVRDEGDLARIAASVRASGPGPEAAQNPATAVGIALSHALNAFHNAPPCDARTIDLSGDGENNNGPAPAAVYVDFPPDITVNALVIGGAGRHIDAFWEDQRLLDWFEAEVIRGPGAFAILADDFADYARAMERKLLREVEPALLALQLKQTDVVR